MRRLLRFASAAALVLTLASSAHASIVRSLDVEDLTHRADVVVHGKVLGQSSAWTRGGRIMTSVQIQVNSSIKGQAPQVITVRYVGGQVGDIAQQVSGEVRFTDGEEVVLFLRAHPALQATYGVVGLSQGKFRVERAASKAAVRQQLEGLELMREDGRIEPAGQPAELSFDALVSRIRKAAAAK